MKYHTCFGWFFFQLFLHAWNRSNPSRIFIIRDSAISNLECVWAFSIHKQQISFFFSFLMQNRIRETNNGFFENEKKIYTHSQSHHMFSWPSVRLKYYVNLNENHLTTITIIANPQVVWVEQENIKIKFIFLMRLKQTKIFFFFVFHFFFVIFFIFSLGVAKKLANHKMRITKRTIMQSNLCMGFIESLEIFFFVFWFSFFFFIVFLGRQGKAKPSL